MAGTGTQPCFCFHGYGETGEAFAFLTEALGERYRVFCMDLPYHGSSRWEAASAFRPEDLQGIILAILSENPGAGGKLTLAGFSLGGRMALHLFQLMPERVERLVLLAPDGLKMNGWYWLATQTRLGNRLFELTMKSPGWFMALLHGFNKLGLVNASVFKFVRYSIHDATVRRQLYERWTGLRRIRPSIPVIKKLIRQHHTSVRMVYGLHDRIIADAAGFRFRKGLEDDCIVFQIHAGHQVLHQKHVAEILPAFLQ